MCSYGGHSTCHTDRAEISEDQMRRSKGDLFGTCHSKRRSYRHLSFGRLTGRQRKGKPHSRRKGRVQVCRDWTRGLGPLEAGWPEAGHLVWLVRGHIWLVFLWLVLSWKQEQELGSRQLVSLGHLGPMGTVTVCFPALLLEIVVWLPVSLIDGGAGFRANCCRLWVRFIFTCGLAIVSLYI